MIRLESREIPPGINNLYTVYYGRKVLSGKAKQWKNRFVASRGGLSVWELAETELDQTRELKMVVWLHLPRTTLYLKKPSKRTGSPFRKRDLDNLIKLLQDSVFQLLKFDDTAVFDLVMHKRGVPEDEAKMVVFIGYSDMEAV